MQFFFLLFFTGGIAGFTGKAKQNQTVQVPTVSLSIWQEEPENLAITRGPVVLVRDSRLPGPVIDAWITPLTNKDGTINLEPIAPNTKGFCMQFTAHE